MDFSSGKNEAKLSSITTRQTVKENLDASQVFLPTLYIKSSSSRLNAVTSEIAYLQLHCEYSNHVVGVPHV